MATIETYSAGGFGFGVSPVRVATLLRDLADRIEKREAHAQQLIEAELSKLEDFVERRLVLRYVEQQKCLCVVGCSVNGQCPIHGDNR